RVVEISNRITEAFTQAKSKVKGHDIGILIIDEADDLATDREQNQAHHEDRTGLNVLIKQIDTVGREKSNLAVILITNRLKVLDPAVVR
ncbi:AAA family ATPase, partial [Salmonella enterica]|uniref:AAA family ATPase n=1 Tax=Salmonella enterica TaxID=28901 RepID=UPI003D283FD1